MLALRRAQARLEGRRAPAPRASTPASTTGRNVLFITVDQQRYDALGVNGGRVAKTPTLDALARSGINYRRAHVQNVVCMPSRATMLTGQHPRTHGVVANGIRLPDDAPSVAEALARAGYRTALIGKAHFDPHLDPTLRYTENQLAARPHSGRWHGFEHLELATHGPIGGHHYADFIRRQHPEMVAGFSSVLTGMGGGDTGAPEVAHNPIPRELYHTDWVAERTLAWLRERTRTPEQRWFCWMSFPDPHHPFDPPLSEVRRRIDWRDLALPPGRPARADIERVLAKKPAHWRMWWQGRFTNPEGGPTAFRPGALSDDALREMHAMIHVENELIDDAVKRVLCLLVESGVDENTDIFYTSDHGELQGDLGLFFKGPYHVTSLLHIPLFWRPAPSLGISPAEITEPVGHVDLAPTFAEVAGLGTLDWMQGATLPQTSGSKRERVITTFDSQFARVGMHLETIYRDGQLCTRYLPSTRDQGGKFSLYWPIWGRGCEIPRFDGSEGELYDLNADPHQFENRFGEPEYRARRDELLADLREHLPPARREPLPVAAPT
ncbi:MAG: sulfatase-like hydrolase/transferase [Myxococcales bacterium]|nr:sulfatase-like hydrolase/transferase [Myxococcales bacterium]